MRRSVSKLLIPTILLGFGALVGAITSVAYSAQSQEPWLAVATVLLVGVTGYYAWQTKNTVKALEKSTEAQFLPHIKMWMFHLGPTYPLLKIGNVGTGPAMNVAVTFRVKELNGSERTWKTPLLSRGDSQQLWIPIGLGKNLTEEPIPFLEKNQCTLTMEATCNDVLGKVHQTKDALDLTVWVGQFGKVSAIWEQERLKLIQDEIEGVKNVLRPIGELAEEIDRARLREVALKYLKDTSQPET